MANEIIPWNEFQAELNAREAEITSLLPSSISRERFINTAIISVKRNPDLLQCTRRSLHNAITAAAFDGMLPDGREGVILPQNEKVKRKQVDGSTKDEWLKTARWQSMAWGIRKRARELDNIVIDTQVVYENDAFEFELGDDPYIQHKRPPLGTAKGKMIGAYAIFRGEDGILHREVMDLEDIGSVKSISKNPNGLLWTKFEGEAYRKSVLRRGIKTVPCSEKLQAIVERFDDDFDVSGGVALKPITIPSIAAQEPGDLLRTADEAQAAPPEDVQDAIPEDPKAVIDELRLALTGAHDAVEVNQAWDEMAERLTLAGRDAFLRAQELYDGRLKELAEMATKLQTIAEPQGMPASSFIAPKEKVKVRIPSVGI